MTEQESMVAISELGEHGVAVLELKDAVCSCTILGSPRPIDDPDVVVIRDFPSAKALTDDKPLKLANGERVLPFDGVYAIECEQIVRDLKSRYDWKIFSRLLQNNVIAWTDSCISNSLRNTPYEVLSYAIAGHILWLARYRALLGCTHPQFEKVLDIYKHGAYPCGWIGKYPEGKIVVFQPEM